MACANARAWLLGLLVCGGLAAGEVALAAPQPAATTASPTPAAAGHVDVQRRTAPPALALRPEVSEGEWATDTVREQLSPNDLASADTTVIPARSAARAARNGATVGGLRERNLQDAPMLAVSSLDQPLRQVSTENVPLPVGLEVFRLGTQFGFTVSQDGGN